MVKYSYSWALAFVICFAAAGCRGPSGTSVKPAGSLPELAPARLIEPGVRAFDVTLPDRGQRLWVYLPEPFPKSPTPCIFIAPAGSPLIYGMRLAEEDRPEHIPYARAGFAVVAYELSGAVTNRSSDAEVIQGIRSFKDADGGLESARA